MENDKPCAACSWTEQRRDSCRYHSNIKLFYEMSNRGVWAIGSKLIVKETSDYPPNHEARDTQFVRSHTTIPVLEAVQEWTENGRYFLVSKRVPGSTLYELWPTMSETERESVAKQTADYLRQLRSLTSTRMEGLGGEPIYSSFLFLVGDDIPHGPLASDEELWEEMAKALSKVPETVRLRFKQRMPPATPYTFTHGDLTTRNIMVSDGKVTGIIDWESSGFFPVWWEFVVTRVTNDDDDRAWKTLLRKHMEDHSDAEEFWMDYYSLRQYPTLDSHTQRLIRELEN
ncbi:hypothetical protein CP532_0360 [Ophiocordyceps camponoti-leonardi (nom. inval.)]|nr:hypothetical protein CP532_0360 [Ophiocordyceps camponoti-leonardi (nom. inval.)]